MRSSNAGTLGGRILLVLLTLYALTMIVPDMYRIVRPLGSFGLAMNDDGLIYGVRGPFFEDTESPAWQAGIRPGDRIDLGQMRCIPIDTEVCASMLALWGGLNYVMPGRTATLWLAENQDRAGRQVTLVAQQRPRNRVLDIVLVLDQVAGILFVLGAAWLVWIRPGAMTWGFFAYAIQFNPGQAFQFYAWLQLWPPAMLIEEVIGSLMQAAGYAGFLLFALRVPGDRADGQWRRAELVVPVVAVLVAVLALASLGSAFGQSTETVLRASVFIGFGVDIAALAILLARRRSLPPRDYQRLRWVIWGCLIGLPSYLVAQLTQVTSLPSSILGIGAVSDDVTGLLYLANGVMCLFVIEAVRRPTVVNVSIPLRRATVLGLLLSAPAMFLHREVDAIHEFIELPGWAWIVVASALVFIISRLHHHGTELTDRLFDRDFRRAEAHLAKVGQSIQQAHSLAEIERLLVEEPLRSLRLVSAGLFRERDGTFLRQASIGWDAATSGTLDEADALLAARHAGVPFSIEAESTPAMTFPADLARPTLAVPVGNARRCFAVVLYSGHENGTALDHNERELLHGLARRAEVAYAQVESELLRARVATLEIQLALASAVA